MKIDLEHLKIFNKKAIQRKGKPMSDSPIKFDQNPMLAAERMKPHVPEKHRIYFDSIVNRYFFKNENHWREFWMELNEFCAELLMDEPWKKSLIKAFRLED